MGSVGPFKTREEARIVARKLRKTYDRATVYRDYDGNWAVNYAVAVIDK